MRIVLDMAIARTSFVSAARRRKAAKAPRGHNTIILHSLSSPHGFYATINDTAVARMHKGTYVFDFCFFSESSSSSYIGFSSLSTEIVSDISRVSCPLLLFLFAVAVCHRRHCFGCCRLFPGHLFRWHLICLRRRSLLLPVAHLHSFVALYLLLVVNLSFVCFLYSCVVVIVFSSLLCVVIVLSCFRLRRCRLFLTSSLRTSPVQFVARQLFRGPIFHRHLSSSPVAVRVIAVAFLACQSFVDCRLSWSSRALLVVVCRHCVLTCLNCSSLSCLPF